MSGYYFPTKNGELLSTQPVANDNMNRSTAEIMFLRQQSDLSLELGLMDLEPKPGVLSRRWLEMVDTSIDDYLVRCCEEAFAARFLARGRSKLGYYSCRTWFRPKQMLGVYPAFLGMWQHAKINAKEPITDLGADIWAEAIEIASHKKDIDQDGWTQSRLMVISAQRRFPTGMPRPMRDAIVYYEARRPEPTWQTAARYIGDITHPLVDAWRPYG